MEKYIIILFILGTIYFIQNKLKDTDGFEDAETKEKPKVPVQNMVGIDDTNAINTLAQISKQLMAGGLTVPGDMSVIGNITANNLINLSNTKTKVSFQNDADNYFRIKDNDGKPLLAIGQGGDIFSKDNNLVLSGGNLAVKSNITATGAIINGRNIIGEIDAINAAIKKINDTLFTTVSYNDTFRLKRTLQKDDENAWFKGDGWKGLNDDWTKWYMQKSW